MHGNRAFSKHKGVARLALPLLLAALALAALSGRGVQAQEGEQNLLANPSFEGGYSTFVPNPPSPDCPSGSCATAQMAAGWTPWWVSQAAEDKDTENAWRNRMPEFKRAQDPFWNRIHAGEAAQQYFTFWGSHTAGLFQRVNVPANAQLRFTIWGQAWSTDTDDAVSSAPAAVNMRIGLDPTGGTNPFSPNIIWSGTANPYDQYIQFSMEGQALGEWVTVFTYARQDEPRKHNDIYWDDAALVVIGAGSAPAPAPQPAGSGEGNPAPAPVAAPVFVLGPTPTPDAEGVIYVAVPPGGSLWSVAANVGITLDEILAYNNLNKGDFVRAGDLLIVGYGEPDGAAAAETAGEPSGQADAGTASSDSSAALPQATATPPAAASQPQVSALTIPAAGTAPQPAAEIAAAGNAVTAVVVTNPERQDTAICLLAFDDDNRNGQQDPGEPLRANVAFTLARGQQVVSNYVTNGVDEPTCINGLSSGNYQITRSQQAGEALTTRGDWGIALTEGSSVTLQFGSYTDSPSVAAAGSSPAPESAPGEGTVAQASGSGLSLSAIVTVAAVVLAVLLLIGVVFLIVTARRPSA